MNYDFLFPIVGLSGIVISTLVVFLSLNQILKKYQSKSSQTRSRGAKTKASVAEFDLIDSEINETLSKIETLVPAGSKSGLEERLNAVEAHVSKKREKLKLKLASVQHLEKGLHNEIETLESPEKLISELKTEGESFRNALTKSRDEIEKVYQELPNQLCINESDEILEILSLQYDKSSNELRDLGEEFERALMQAETLERQIEASKSS